MYTFSLAHWLTASVLLLFDYLLLIDGKLRFNSNKENFKD